MSIGRNGWKQYRERLRRQDKDRVGWAQSRLNLKAEIARFWQHCNRQDMTPAARLGRLIEFASVVVATPPTRYRRFQRARFVSGFCPRGKFCFGCDKSARIRHHIIQLQNGGSNVKLNIVSLCVKCHAEIHPWLQPASKSVTPADKEKDSPAPTDCSQNGSQPETLEPRDLHQNFELLARMDGEGLSTYEVPSKERANNPIEYELIPNCPEYKAP